MKYATLSNGIKMPMLGYGVYQVTKEECERCVLDALKVGYRSLIPHRVILTRKKSEVPFKNREFPAMKSSLPQRFG